MKALLRTTFLIISFGLPVWSQSSTGSVHGSVRDASDAAIPAASVALTSTSIAFGATAITTNQSGATFNVAGSGGFTSSSGTPPTFTNAGLLQKTAEAGAFPVAIPIVNSDGGTVIERHATTALARLHQGRHAEAVSEADAVIEMLTSRLPTGWVWGEFGVLALEVLLELRTGGIGDVPAAGLDRPAVRADAQ